MYSTRISDRVYLLDTFALGNPNVVGAYLIKGPKVTLVDCGYPSSHQTVMAGLREQGVAPSDVRYLVATHVHLDHAGGMGHLVSEMPNAEVIAHEKSVPHLANPERLLESATRVFGKKMMDLYGPPIPVPEARMTAVGKETHLDLGQGMTATIIHSPGHAPHQISMMLDKQKLLLTADAVGVVYPGMKFLIPTTPPPSLDPKALVDTVNQLEQMDSLALLVPHFGVRTDSEYVFRETKDKMEDWVEAVRKMRQSKLTFDQIVDRMVEEVRAEAGGGDLPIYVQVLTRVSVMGIDHFLGKNT
jgi:glyoxylase-like metal-dependent hydrolase (beta-lactamase superfamily II)